jgi:hypothetical protein
MSAIVRLVLTSIESKVFDVLKAITEIDFKGARQAIMVITDVMDENRHVVFSIKFNLGSKDAEKIETNSEYLKRFAFLY